jgi:hypothetical protein
MFQKPLPMVGANTGLLGLVSIEGCAGCEVEPIAPRDTPTPPVEAGGVTTELPLLGNAGPLPDLPEPTDAPAPAEPDVWAWAIETTEAAVPTGLREAFRRGVNAVVVAVVVGS